VILGVPTFTFIHVAVSLAGIGSGLVVVAGLLTARRLETWTAVFLATTVNTSVTGFGFPFVRLLPSHVVGIVSLVVLGAAIFARYGRDLGGAWRWIYAVGAVLALYLNVFVLIVQLFRKIPALAVLAPTESEPPFALTQLAALAVFAALGIAAAKRFHPDALG
jgi:hypothetical protein